MSSTPLTSSAHPPAISRKGSGPAAVKLAGRARAVITALNAHFAGVTLLALVDIYLLLHMAFAYQAAHSDNAEALAEQRISMQTAQIAAKPLEGLDSKLAQASGDADNFSQRRLPFAYSEVAGELGLLAKRQHVKLSRVQYAQAPVMANTAGELIEVKMDASLSGDYRPLVLFVNALERDRTFFLISGVTLTGQQSGTVNLRVRLTTWLREPHGEERVSSAVTTPSGNAAVRGPLSTGDTTDPAPSDNSTDPGPPASQSNPNSHAARRGGPQ